MLFVVPSQALVRYVGRRAAGAGRPGRAGRDLHRLGALHAHALPPRRADQVQRRPARERVARQEAPGAARSCSSTSVAQQAETIGARARGVRAARCSPSGTGWSGARSCRGSPGSRSWVKKQTRSRCQRARRARGSGQALRRSAPTTCVLDWAELLTDPRRARRGLRRHRRHRDRDLERAGRVGASASSRSRRSRPSTRKATRCSTPRASRSAPTTTIRRAGSTTRTTRSCCAWSSSSAAALMPPGGDELRLRARRDRRGAGPLGARGQGAGRGRARTRRRPDQALGDDRRRHRAAPGVRQQLHRLGASCSS